MTERYTISLVCIVCRIWIKYKISLGPLWSLNSEAPLFLYNIVDTIIWGCGSGKGALKSYPLDVFSQAIIENNHFTFLIAPDAQKFLVCCAGRFQIHWDKCSGETMSDHAAGKRNTSLGVEIHGAVAARPWCDGEPCPVGGVVLNRMTTAPCISTLIESSSPACTTIFLYEYYYYYY